MTDHTPAKRTRPRGRAWSTRAFVSLLLLVQTAVVTVSGIVRYVSPRGREAHWVDWRVWGLDKDQWSSVHMVSAALFLALAVLHLAYNWRAMVAYLGRAAGTLRGRGTEVSVVLLVTVGLLALTILDVPPANLAFRYSEQLKEDYAASVERAPWAHAEDATVEQVSRRLGLPVATVLADLEDAGMPARDGTETLAEIARRYGTSPAQVYEAFAAGLSPVRGRGRGRGAGRGRP